MLDSTEDMSLFHIQQKLNEKIKKVKGEFSDLSKKMFRPFYIIYGKQVESLSIGWGENGMGTPLDVKEIPSEIDSFHYLKNLSMSHLHILNFPHCAHHENLEVLSFRCHADERVYGCAIAQRDVQVPVPDPTRRLLAWILGNPGD